MHTGYTGKHLPGIVPSSLAGLPSPSYQQSHDSHRRRPHRRSITSPRRREARWFFTLITSCPRPGLGVRLLRFLWPPGLLLLLRKYLDWILRQEFTPSTPAFWDTLRFYTSWHLGVCLRIQIKDFWTPVFPFSHALSMASAIFRYSVNIMSLTELEFGGRKSSLVLFLVGYGMAQSLTDVQWSWECRCRPLPQTRASWAWNYN